MQAYIADVTQSYVDWNSNSSIIVYFSGCDFRCPYCFAADILDFKEEFLKDIREVKSQIKSLVNTSSNIFFTGGEPCLQKPALVELSKFSKQQGLKIGLQTNGSNPKVLRLLLDLNLPNYISLDIKTPFDDIIFEKTTKSKTFFKQTKDIMKDIKDTIDILRKNNRISIDIRTTIAPSVIFNKEHILRIASEIKNLDCRWIFQQFQPYKRLVDNKMQGLNPPSLNFL